MKTRFAKQRLMKTLKAEEVKSASSSTKSTIGDASTPRSDTNRPLSSKPNSASTADISA
jgi:hypothetical protein